MLADTDNVIRFEDLSKQRDYDEHREYNNFNELSEVLDLFLEKYVDPQQRQFLREKVKETERIYRERQREHLAQHAPDSSQPTGDMSSEYNTDPEEAFLKRTEPLRLKLTEGDQRIQTLLQEIASAQHVLEKIQWYQFWRFKERSRLRKEGRDLQEEMGRQKRMQEETQEWLKEEERLHALT